MSDFAIYGICYTLAMIFSNSSLKHVNYPTQVLAKSCKMIPVLLAGTLFGSGFIVFNIACILPPFGMIY